MDSIKICSTGLQMLHKLEQMARQAEFVALGSFGFDSGLEVWRYLPKASHIIVGCPREEEKASFLCRRLTYFKKARPDLIIGTRTDFHAKYGLIRMARSQWVMVGSANCTPSPAHEVVVFGRDDEIYKSLAKKHERWLSGSQLVEPDSTPKLSKSALASLSSAVVGG